MIGACGFRSATDDVSHSMSPMRVLPCRGNDEHHRRTCAQLHAALCAHAAAEGANVGPWPGSTIYRFTRPGRPQWNEIDCLSVGIILQSATALTAVGERRLESRAGYLVIDGREQFDCRFLKVSPDQPTVCLVLAIDAELVRSVWTAMRSLGTALNDPDDGDMCPVSALDGKLMNAVIHFIDSLSGDCDRRVLAPLHLQEMVYRTLQGGQGGRLAQLAARQTSVDSVAVALHFIRAHLADPLTVDTLAAHACLSPSAFSRVFRQRTGRSPYRYVKEARLDRARQSFDEGRSGVADVARSVGYASVSHFIKEFRLRFNSTPGDYAAGQNAGVTKITPLKLSHSGLNAENRTLYQVLSRICGHSTPTPIPGY